MGRTESKARLSSQEAMPASMSALASAKYSFTSWSRVWWSRWDTTLASRHQCPGGVSELGPSDQYSEIAFFRSVRFALIANNALAWSR